MTAHRTIEYDKVVSVVQQLCIDSCYELPADVVEALNNAVKKESNPGAKDILNQLLLNAKIAGDERIPICQDTGLAIVFIEQGAGVAIHSLQNKTLYEAINEGVAFGYETGLLRKSVVSEPLNIRANTNNNAPAIIHHTIVPGDKLKISVMTKGGGCENKSQYNMFLPTDDKSTVADWIVEVVKNSRSQRLPAFRYRRRPSAGISNFHVC